MTLNWFNSQFNLTRLESMERRRVWVDKNIAQFFVVIEMVWPPKWNVGENMAKGSTEMGIHNKKKPE